MSCQRAPDCRTCAHYHAIKGRCICLYRCVDGGLWVVTPVVKLWEKFVRLK